MYQTIHMYKPGLLSTPSSASSCLIISKLDSAEVTPHRKGEKHNKTVTEIVVKSLNFAIVVPTRVLICHQMIDLKVLR